ncbi:hypothetical protein GOBAR_DD14107 [Gossypium barbadense]|nr:hypothetical protein GOBAR_DD14107 [Gossypium barbadense]
MKSYSYSCSSTFFLLSIIVITSTSTRATNDDSQWLATEAKALMKTGWWSNHRRVGDHCMWPGIRCNAGSVIEIDLSGHGLNGGITPQIGALSKLKDGESCFSKFDKKPYSSYTFSYSSFDQSHPLDSGLKSIGQHSSRNMQP